MRHSVTNSCSEHILSSSSSYNNYYYHYYFHHHHYKCYFHYLQYDKLFLKVFSFLKISVCPCPFQSQSCRRCQMSCIENNANLPQFPSSSFHVNTSPPPPPPNKKTKTKKWEKQSTDWNPHDFTCSRGE